MRSRWERYRRFDYGGEKHGTSESDIVEDVRQRYAIQGGIQFEDGKVKFLNEGWPWQAKRNAYFRKTKLILEA